MHPCSFPLSLGARRNVALLPHSQAAPLEDCISMGNEIMVALHAELWLQQT